MTKGSPTNTASNKEWKMSRYTIKDSNNCFNTANTYSVWNNWTIADDRSQLLTWLLPLEPRFRHRDIQDRRVNDVGEWVIQTEEFKRWYGFQEASLAMDRGRWILEPGPNPAQ